MTPGESHNEWYQYYCSNIYPFNWPNLRALSYASLLILTHKLHCTSKGDALKWPALKSDSSNSIV